MNVIELQNEQTSERKKNTPKFKGCMAYNEENSITAMATTSTTATIPRRKYALK